MADINPLRQAAGDHIPAHKALQAAQREQPQKRRQLRAADFLLREEDNKRNEKHQADNASKKAMPPLPPINEFELGQAHAEIDQLIFRDLLIFLELGQPISLRERRQRTAYRRPFGNRQAAIGQPREATDQHHQHHKTGNRKQPQGDLAVSSAGRRYGVCAHGLYIGVSSAHRLATKHRERQ